MGKRGKEGNDPIGVVTHAILDSITMAYLGMTFIPRVGINQPVLVLYQWCLWEVVSGSIWCLSSVGAKGYKGLGFPYYYYYYFSR
jgi:hypothetical protein